MELNHVTAEDFRREVLDSSIPVVVDFYADWCGPCHSVAPVLEHLAVKWAGDAKFVKVDTEAEPELASAYRISTIPAILAFRGGEVTGWSIGVKPGYLIERELGIKAAGDDGEARWALRSLLRLWQR